MEIIFPRESCFIDHTRLRRPPVSDHVYPLYAADHGAEALGQCCYCLSLSSQPENTRGVDGGHARLSRWESEKILFILRDNLNTVGLDGRSRIGRLHLNPFLGYPKLV